MSGLQPMTEIQIISIVLGAYVAAIVCTWISEIMNTDIGDDE